MKSLRLCTDGVGSSELESLALQFVFFGPTATEPDAATMPGPESMVAGHHVRAVRLSGGEEAWMPQ